MERLISSLKKLTYTFRYKDFSFPLLHSVETSSHGGALSVDSLTKKDSSYNFRWNRLSYSQRKIIQHNIETHNKILFVRRILLYSLSALVVSTIVLVIYFSQMNGFHPW
ncbi:MAG: hypothetical protein JEZ14_06555 [Marinilabiliaceae bacterium]|nr:hypothetical protein [Marinilabiliaceae bacterium]